MSNYQETVFSKVTTSVLGAVTLALLSLWVYQVAVAPIGTDPAPNTFYLLLAVFFAAMTFNFRKLVIKISGEGIKVGFGVFKKSVPWKNIEDCYIDETSAIRYGGWGVRFSRVKGNWRRVYNVFGGPRVVIRLKTGFFRELAFSTRNPEKVVEKVKERI